MKYTYLILIAIACFGCTSTQKPSGQDTPEAQLPYIIDLSELEFSDTPQCLSEFADSISYIRLSEEPLLRDLGLTTLYLDRNNNIYIDDRLIYKYTPKGEFVKSLFRFGQGPEEVIQKLGSGIYNSEEESVLVNNYGSESFRKYSLNGDFLDDISKEEGPGFYKQIVASIGDKEIFYSIPVHPNRGDKVNYDGAYLWYVKDLSKDSIVYKMKNSLFHIKAEMGYGLMQEGAYPLYLQTIDSVLCIRHVHQDTLFRTTDALKWEPWYVIKHHERDANYSMLIRFRVFDVSISEINGKYRVHEVYPLPSGVLFLYSELNSTSKKTGFCKHGEKALTCSTKSFKNDLDDCLTSLDILSQPHFQKNGYLYVLVDAFEFFKEGAKSPFPDLTEESNPVLVKIKLKEAYEQ